MTRSRVIASSFVLLSSLAIACGSSDRAATFDQDQTSKSSSSSGGDGTGDGTGNGSLGSSSGDGTGGDGNDATCAATVAQTTKPKVDIIFVIDNSGSMDGEMAQIQTNVNKFVTMIGGSGLDYQVIFIVKKTGSGNKICVPEPLAKAGCADNPPIFHHIDQDVQSNNSLKLILSTFDSPTPTIAWKQHLRADAFKVFVGVSDDGDTDQDDVSFDAQLTAKPGGQFGTVAARNYVYHAICAWKVGTTAPSSTQCDTADGNGLQYQKLALLTGGIIDSVCKTDYSGVLDNIGKGIVDRLACELGYPTAQAADPTKVQVRLTPPNAAGKTLTQVTDAAKCGSNPDGWYYDDANKPSKIILCKATCDAANAAEGSKVEALVGCKGAGPK